MLGYWVVRMYCTCACTNYLLSTRSTLLAIFFFIIWSHWLCNTYLIKYSKRFWIGGYRVFFARLWTSSEKDVDARPVTLLRAQNIHFVSLQQSLKNKGRCYLLCKGQKNRRPHSSDFNLRVVSEAQSSARWSRTLSEHQIPAGAFAFNLASVVQRAYNFIPDPATKSLSSG